MQSYDIVEWGKPLQKQERETPKPTGTEVLLKMKFCGVCHSDVHIRDGYFELGGGKRFYMTERGMKLPHTLGHEPFGTVIAAGPDADAPIGQDRLVYPWIGCGTCARCREGYDNYCMAPRFVGVQRNGGYADHLLIPHPRYLIDSTGVDPHGRRHCRAPASPPIRRSPSCCRFPKEEWVAVMGAGGLGLMAIQMLRALGHERIVAVDIDASKLQAARASGATGTVDGRDPEAAKKLVDVTGGPIYGAVDLVGATGTATLALGALRKGGQLVLVGLVRRRASALDRADHPARPHHSRLVRRHRRRSSKRWWRSRATASSSRSRSNSGRSKK